MNAGALSLRDLAFLVIACIVLMAPGVFTMPPVDRDESRYAVASTQMLDTGDFVDIRYQEHPRYLQPAGVYWLQSATAGVFTDPNAREIWAFRLPSLLAAIAAVVLTGIGMSRLAGRQTGLIAAAFLAACLSLNFEARIAKTDAALLAACTVAQFALMRAYLNRSAGLANAAAFWAALGVGLLIKGPIILILSGLTAVSLVIVDRRADWLARLRPLAGVPLFLAIALPWYVAIGMATKGAFFDVAIGANLLHKVGNDQQSHGGPPGYHLALFVLTFWPASLMAAFAVPYAWRERADPMTRFLIAWIVPTWIVFEFVATKLPHYVLPTFPAIAMLCALGLIKAQRATSLPGRIVEAIYVLLWIAVTIVVCALGPALMRTFTESIDPLSTIVAIGAAISAVAMAWFTVRRRPTAAAAAGIAAAALAFANVYALTAPRIEALWLSPRIVEAARAQSACPGGHIITAPYVEPSLVFLAGPTNVTLAKSGEDVADAAAVRACSIVVVGAPYEETFRDRAAALGLAATPFAKIDGQNYSDGDQYALQMLIVRGRAP